MSKTTTTNETWLKTRQTRDGTFEGTVTVPGLRPTKLVRADGTTTWATRSGVTQAAKAFAERLGLTLNVEETATTKTRKTTTRTATKQGTVEGSSQQLF